VRQEAVEVDFEQEDERRAHALAHLGGGVDGEGEEALQVDVDRVGQRLRHHLQELVDAAQRHLAHELVRRVERV
jgi:hypothetical protein